METIHFPLVTREAVAQQKILVDNLHAAAMRRLHSEDFEAYRDRWAKARAKLSQMQGKLFFAGKEVCRG